jgi:hypothetical protein
MCVPVKKVTAERHRLSDAFKLPALANIFGKYK